MRVSNMESSRGNLVPNQFELTGLPAGTYYDGNERLGSGNAFQSYSSMIAYVELGTRIYLDVNYWDYSRTTSKYRNAFLNMNTGEIKAGIKDGSIKLINLH